MRLRRDRMLVHLDIRPAATAVLLVYSDREDSLRPVFRANKDYCARHSYQMLLRSLPTHPAFHASWQKVQLVLDYVRHFATALLLDDDAFVAKPWERVESVMERFLHASLVAAAHDCAACRRHLNMGVVLFRSSPWLLSFLQRLLHDGQCDRLLPSCCWEQDCVELLLTPKERQTHIGVAPMGEFACQPSHQSYSGTCDPFVFHALGQGRKQSLLGRARFTVAWMRSRVRGARSGARAPPLDAGMENDDWFWRRMKGRLPPASAAHSILLRSVAASKNWTGSDYQLSLACRGLCAYRQLIPPADGIAGSDRRIRALVESLARPDVSAPRCRLAVHDIGARRCLLYDEWPAAAAPASASPSGNFRAWEWRGTSPSGSLDSAGNPPRRWRRSDAPPPRPLHFLHIPKTGGTSIEKLGRFLGHWWGSALYNCTGEGGCYPPKSLFSWQGVQRRCPLFHIPLDAASRAAIAAETFCVVRDPYDRFVSEYKWRTAHWRSLGCNASDMNAYLEPLLSGRSVDDCHFVAQHRFIHDEVNAAVLCDHVLPFEALAEAVPRLLRTSRPLPHTRNVGSRCRLTAEQLNARNRRLIRTRYAEDIELHARAVRA